MKRHGFTIVELIVTMAILGLMLFLINQLFNDTSSAVQTSVQTSKTIATTRSINEQLSADADAMVGPGLGNDGGYIVIIQQRLPNIPMLDPQTLAELPNDVDLRSDQLLFIRDAVGLKSMTPAGASTYGTNFVGQPGGRAKVWYGHAQRTQPNGQPRTGANTGLGGSAAKLDRVGSNWIMGRQAMLFNPTNEATSNTLSSVPSGFTHAATAAYNSTVNNATGYTSPIAWKGLSDITAQDYGPYDPNNAPVTLLDQLSDPAITLATRNASYHSTAYPDASSRLHVNTAPDAGSTNYASWSIAQTHAILAQGCSEIIVDFAADLNGDGDFDRTTGGAILWYDALRQSAFSWTNPGSGIQPRTLDGTNQKIFVFRADDDGEHNSVTDPGSSWPYMIRIRYRLHDTRGRLTSNYNEVLVDNDGDGTTDEIDDDKISGRWFERIISVPRP